MTVNLTRVNRRLTRRGSTANSYDVLASVAGRVRRGRNRIVSLLTQTMDFATTSEISLSDLLYRCRILAFCLAQESCKQ